jgi:hypothetical protein
MQKLRKMNFAGLKKKKGIRNDLRFWFEQLGGQWCYFLKWDSLGETESLKQKKLLFGICYT